MPFSGTATGAARSTGHENVTPGVSSPLVSPATVHGYQRTEVSQNPLAPSTPISVRRSPRFATQQRTPRQLIPSTPVACQNGPRVTPRQYRKKRKGRKNSIVIEGHRIVDMCFLHQQYVELSKHGERLDCKLESLVIVGEQRTGFRSTLQLYCENCHAQLQLSTSRVDGPLKNINSSIVSATVSAGIGYSQLEEITSIVEIPCMADKTYMEISEELKAHINEVSMEELKAAGREEARLAREDGDLHTDGTPMITVVTDGAWARRSYGTNFASNSGVAVILGYRTKKVLFFGVKNKYCCVCQRAENAKTNAPPHSCSKNWTGSSTAMESAIIVEGFKQSIEMHGVIYGRLIGDGDSSTYRKITDASPYGPTVSVEKLECTNHILRNYTGRLIKDVVMNTKRGSPQLRSLVKSRLLRLRTAVVSATRYRKDEVGTSSPEKITQLQDDITNSVYHVFGQHNRCAAYFCKGAKPDEVNLIPELEAAGLLVEIRAALSRVRDNARSLLFSVSNNLAESFNSVVAKLAAGKRINFTRRGAYEMRCAAAAIQFNTKSFSSSIHRRTAGQSPGVRLKRLTSRNEKNRRRVATKRRCFPSAETSVPKRQKVLALADADYGPEANVPTLEITHPAKYESECARFVASLQVSADDRAALERATVGQSTSAQWIAARRSRLTASNFSTVCRMRPTTCTSKTVERLLYGAPIHSAALSWGREHEDVAIERLQIVTRMTIQKCGMFVHLEHGFLGASPDGLVAGEDAIVEVKCPFSARDLTIGDAVQEKKIDYLQENAGMYSLKPSHSYYYQVQGELEITGRSTCYFVVWTSKDFLILTIKRDSDFWKNEMFPYLREFYFNSLLPELVDPRGAGNLRKVFMQTRKNAKLMKSGKATSKPNV